MSGLGLAAELCRAVRNKATCEVEWREGERRRAFYFYAGALVLVQSNIASESSERVRARTPGVDPDSLGTVVAQVRVREALGEPGGTVQVRPDTEVSTTDKLDAVALLWGAADRLAPVPAAASPSALPLQARLLARIPVPAEITRYLLELDGRRPMEDVVEFGPGAPDVIARAVALAWALGAVEADAVEADAASTHAPAPRAAAGTAFPIAAEATSSAVASRASAPPSGDAVAAQRSFGGSSGTVSYVPTRPVATPKAETLESRFGPVLPRIRRAKDHFGVLDTRWDDPLEVHRQAYFALAQQLHPDRYANEPADVREVAGDLFDRVRGAWEVLRDDQRRDAYIARVVRGEQSDDQKAMARVRLILEAESEFKRAVTMLQAGRLPIAHEVFAKVARAVPEEPEFSAYAGYTTFRLEHTRDQAAAEAGAARVRAALDKNDKLDNVWLLHGLILRARSEDIAARHAFTTALQLRPSNPDAARELKRMDREEELEEPDEPEGGGFLSWLFRKW